MDTEQLNAIAQMIIQGMISAVFIWAWSQERKERQDNAVKHAVERDKWMDSLISLMREMNAQRGGIMPVPMNGKDQNLN